MQGDTEVIDQLNQLLEGELTAIDQYFIHSRMYDDWGLKRLHERLDHEREEESEHASALIERLLFLEATPDLSKRTPLNVGHDVPQMLANDLKLELDVVAALRRAIAVCEKQQDFQTRQILLGLLKDTEEDHTYWLEQQLGLIDKVGLQNYLQSQID